MAPYVGWNATCNRRGMRSRPLLLIVAGLVAVPLLAVGCAGASDGDDSTEQAYRGDGGAHRGRIELLVTVDWEGRDLLDANLSAMEELRTRYPEVKIDHFLNAAYFTKPGADPASVEASMRRPLRSGDEAGLHVHGWKRLFEAAGVTFRSTPNFWGTSTLSNDCTYDCGHEVPIDAYTTDELRKVFAFSMDTLQAHGFGRAKSFRCGGWVADANVREALVAEGIRWDDSAVPAPFLKSEIGTLPLYDWLAEMWQGTTSTSQPYVISTAAGDLIEVPDNGALSDYMRADEMVSVYDDIKAAYLLDPSKDIVLSIGFHQETAAKYVPVLEDALGQIFDDAQANHLPLVSVTSTQLPKPASITSDASAADAKSDAEREANDSGTD